MSDLEDPDEGDHRPTVEDEGDESEGGEDDVDEQDLGVEELLIEHLDGRWMHSGSLFSFLLCDNI